VCIGKSYFSIDLGEIIFADESAEVGGSGWDSIAELAFE